MSSLHATRGMLWAGIITWLAVAIPMTLLIASDPSEVRHARSLGWIAAWLVFGITLPWLHRSEERLRAQVAALAVQVIAAGAANFLIPAALPGVATTGALFVISAACCANLLGRVGRMALIIAQTGWLVTSYALADWPWAINAVASGAYLGFQYFAVMVTALAIREAALRRELVASNLSLRLAQASLLEAERREERLRLVRDLHDTAGHHLTGLLMQLQLVRRTLDQPVEASARLEEAAGTARELLDDVRMLVSDARRRPFEDIAHLAERLHRADPAVRIDVPDLTTLGSVPAEIGETAYWIVQESVTNAIRHGAASRVSVDASWHDGVLVVTVTDNGRGLRNGIGGEGIRGMRERADAVGGRIEIGAGADGGTRVTAKLPREGGAR